MSKEGNLVLTLQQFQSVVLNIPASTKSTRIEIRIGVISNEPTEHLLFALGL